MLRQVSKRSASGKSCVSNVNEVGIDVVMGYLAVNRSWAEIPMR
jgi:hypothetical protein